MVSIRSLNGQPLAALGTTTRDNIAAALGGHASTEAVSLCALALIGLVRTLHNVNLLRDSNVNLVKPIDCMFVDNRLSNSLSKPTRVTKKAQISSAAQIWHPKPPHLQVCLHDVVQLLQTVVCL